MKGPRQGLKRVSELRWIKLQESVYKLVEEKKGYKWLKTKGQLKSMRDIFNIPSHIPKKQIKDFIEHKRKEKYDEKE